MKLRGQLRENTLWRTQPSEKTRSTDLVRPRLDPIDAQVLADGVTYAEVLPW